MSAGDHAMPNKEVQAPLLMRLVPKRVFRSLRPRTSDPAEVLEPTFLEMVVKELAQLEQSRGLKHHVGFFATTTYIHVNASEAGFNFRSSRSSQGKRMLFVAVTSCVR